MEGWMSIPGFKRMTAWSIGAEMGTDLSALRDASPAASGAGLAPGNNQSGGKRRSGRTNKGNRWLRRALVQSAGAVSPPEPLLFDRPVLARRCAPGREESHRRHRASMARHRVLHSARRNGLP
jgi:transposase